MIIINNKTMMINYIITFLTEESATAKKTSVLYNAALLPDVVVQ